MLFNNNHPIACAEKYICQLRKAERSHENYIRSGVFMRIYRKFWYLYHNDRLLRLGKAYNLDIGIHSCDEGLMIWHIAGGIVINMNARIGKNLTLHGCNCIGNDGIHPEIAPRIGDNVHLGFGASVLGDVSLADNIWVAAGAVVVTSFLEPGIVVGGVPAKKIKDNHD